MSTYSKWLLSGSMNGRQIPVATPNLPGSVVHVAATGTVIDEVWVYAINNYGSAIQGTWWWGGTTSSDMEILSVTNGAGRVLVADGKLITSGGTVAVTCPANGTYGLVVDGFVNRIM